MDYAKKRESLKALSKKELIDQCLKYYQLAHSKNDAIMNLWELVTDLRIYSKRHGECINYTPHLNIWADYLELYTSYED